MLFQSILTDYAVVFFKDLEIRVLYFLRSLLISFLTVSRYLNLFFSDTKGTDQNCFVLNHNEGFQPKTKL